jgi:hypothetical protein
MKHILLALAGLLMTTAAATADNVIILKRSDVWTGTEYSLGMISGNFDPTYSDTPPLVPPTQTALEKGYPNFAIPGASNSYYVVNFDTNEVHIVDYWNDAGVKQYDVTSGLNLNDLVTDRIRTRTANTFQWFIASQSVDDEAGPSYYSSNEHYTGLGSPLAIPASTASGFPVRAAKTIPDVPRTIAGKWFERFENSFSFSDPPFDFIFYIDMYVTTVTFTLDTVNTPLANNGPKLPVIDETTNAAIPGQFWDGTGSFGAVQNSTSEYAVRLILNNLTKLGYDGI